MMRKMGAIRFHVEEMSFTTNPIEEFCYCYIHILLGLILSTSANLDVWISDLMMA